MSYSVNLAGKHMNIKSNGKYLTALSMNTERIIHVKTEKNTCKHKK